MVETNRQMQEVLDAFARLNPLPIDSLSPEVARELPELKDAVLSVLNQHGALRLIRGPIENIHSVEHILIPGPESLMTARIYRPSDDRHLPLILYFHGGGFVLGNLNSYDASCRSLANSAEAIVVSLAYRKAPEHPYPAAHEDAFAAYRWLLKNAEALGADARRIAVAGESAGGNLAASVCLKARQKGMRQPVHQLLVYPALDDRFTSSSYQEHANAKPLNRAMMQWFWRHYLQGRPADEFCCPAKSRDLAGIAPATILTAEIDPLRTEGEQYADQLRAYDVPVLSRRFTGVTHEFFGMGAVLGEAREAMKIAAGELKRAFAPAVEIRKAA
jgi:acetyl esterase